MSFKLDFHIHSFSRGRVFIDEHQLTRALKESKLDGVAITNFHDISHALWLKERVKGYIIIVGQEICSKGGHIAGLGLKRRIADFQSAEDTIESIHQQGGIAVAVHPYLGLGLGNKIRSLAIDAVESYNALIGFSVLHNYLARRIAERLNLPKFASSDTSDTRFIGVSYTEVGTDNPELILEATKSGRLKLFKRTLPFPASFFLKGFLGLRNVKPSSLHPVPCSICGYSMTVRVFKKKFRCLDCKKEVFSHIACCNGHYLCIECVSKRSSTEAVSFKK